MYLEHYFTKSEILEISLNLSELGEKIYGISKASNFYFNKTPLQLTGKEGAFLAMLLPSPKKYAQSFRDRKLTKFASEQVSNILVKLRQAGIIKEEERLIYENEDLSFEVIDFFSEDLLSVENESY
jgi:monofunctional biosynthetic peptidoglycan transglycosylase